VNTQSNNLPALPTDFGDRFFQGAGAKCVDGRWRLDGVEVNGPKKLFAISTATAAQCWRDGSTVDTIIKKPGEEFPDIDELNKQIPEEEWEEGLDGKPQPPWVISYAVYLLDPADASIYTFANSTTGARIAVARLADKIAMMGMLRGAHVVPVVELSSKEMKTKFGTKMRPDFPVIEWRQLGGAAAAPAIKHQPDEVGKPVKPTTASEELNDSIGF
jgi:hypothetical protein